jgi:hypothetical protein
MFDDTISFNNILTSLESTLSIEMSGDMRVDETINAAVQRLENTYACTFDRDVYSLQSESQLMADNINLLLKDVQQCLAMLSLYTNLKIFHMNMGITLSDVNYLGYAKESLLTALKYLQCETEYKKHADDIITPLYDTLNNIPMCSVKRMFIIMLMFARLGITEGVAIMSQLLYIGGLVV